MSVDNFNFLDYLLTMSVRFKNYKEVTRDYIDSRMLNKVNDDCEVEFCSNCKLMKHIRSVLVEHMVTILLTNMLNGGELTIVGVV